MSRYIDADAAIEAIQKHLINVLGTEHYPVKYDEGISYGYEAAHRHIEEVISNQPTADVAPVVHGKWILAEDGWYCSACKLYPNFDYDPEEKGIQYCPNCGAKMDGWDE